MHQGNKSPSTMPSNQKAWLCSKPLSKGSFGYMPWKQKPRHQARNKASTTQQITKTLAMHQVTKRPWTMPGNQRLGYALRKRNLDYAPCKQNSWHQTRKPKFLLHAKKTKPWLRAKQTKAWHVALGCMPSKRPSYMLGKQRLDYALTNHRKSLVATH